MTLDLIGRYPAVNDHEQMGRLLRYAFPLGLKSFSGVVSKDGQNDSDLDQLGDDASIEETLLALIH